MRSSQTSNNCSLFERIVAVLNYLTFGLVGFIYLILVAFRKLRLTPFLQYHIFMTFFLVILYWLVTVLLSLLVQVLSIIPFINVLVLKVLFYFNAPLFFGKYSLVSGAVQLFVLYLCATSFLGQFSYVPWATDIIIKNVRR